MKKYRLYQVDAFTTQRFKGNSAGVVPNADGLTDLEMQLIARELNNSETAFILSPTSDDHDVWIRFFTPTIEVPICGHATIASHFVRASELGIDSAVIQQKSGVGILPVEIIKDSIGYKIVMNQGSAQFRDPMGMLQSGQIVAALGLEESDLDERCPIQIVSTGHAKVMIGVKHLKTLNSLQPNLTELSRISSKIDCNGFFVFTLDSKDPDIFVNGRMFAPAIGIPEDPVTGNANGPFGAYVAKWHLRTAGQDGMISFFSRQGEAMGRVGEVLVSVALDGDSPSVVKVAGRAVSVFQTEIDL